VETRAYAGVMPTGFAPSEVATTVVTPTITAEAAVSVVTPAASPTRFQREPRPDPGTALTLEAPAATTYPSPTPRQTATPSPTPTPDWPPPAEAPVNRLVIPSINVDTTVVPVGWQIVEEGGQSVSVWDVADYAVGWHKTSAYPGHGENVVMNGHHNIRGKVFRYLVDLQAGDEIIVYAGETAYHYRVTEKHILEEKNAPAEVREQNARWIAATGDERVTLVTCWPYTNNTHRVIVIAKPVID
ncbi:MAG: sortase, partial [Chloroflexota bacterium]|nr:sortase [Chloroflexota bacterium]